MLLAVNDVVILGKPDRLISIARWPEMGDSTCRIEGSAILSRGAGDRSTRVSCHARSPGKAWW